MPKNITSISNYYCWWSMGVEISTEWWN